jgi:hypothetical protein
MAVETARETGVRMLLQSDLIGDADDDIVCVVLWFWSPGAMR